MRLFKRKNGRWYVEFKRGVKRSLGTADAQTAAEIFKDLLKAEANEKLVALDAGENISLADFKKEFLSRHEINNQKTFDAYDLAGRLFIDSAGSSTRLTRVTDKTIAKFKNDCRARGVKQVSINTYLRHLRTYFNQAYYWNYIDKPIRLKIKKDKTAPRIFTQAETELLLLHARHCRPDMYRCIKFALWTGARRIEIKRFCWQHVSAGTATLYGKGDKKRTIPLLPGALAAMGPAADIGPVFVQYDLSTYTHLFKKLARDCGIDDISLHKMRHTAATYMLAAGMDIVYVQEMLGHADIATTRIYAQVLQEGLKKEALKYSGFLKVE
jgi:site-specific recombinase XerD